MKRVFFGMDAIAPWPDNLPTGRHLNPENRHLTLAFLGTVDFEKLKEALIDLPIPSFKVGFAGQFDQCLFLPKKTPHCVSWHIDWFEDISPLENYRRNLIEWLKNKGFISEHRENFLSHVTLARHPFDREKWKKTFAPLPVFTQNIHLYESLGGSKYAPLWSFPLLAPFEEMEHIADLAYWIRGTSFEQLFQHAKLALAFSFPPLLSFFSFKSSFSSIESVIELLNKIVHQADTEIGCPFKAVCYHTTLNQGDIMEWEMIIDV